MQLKMPEARWLEAWQDGGSMLGGPVRRVVWHTTENDPNKTTARTIADYLNRVGFQVHVLWNPVTGEVIQMIPANRAGRGLRNSAGGVQTNRDGSVCVQIEVIGQASHPFTSGPMRGREQIISWIRSLGIPDIWPDGPPPAYNHEGPRSTSNWLKRSGHYGHSQVPENDHNDPGAIDINKLFGKAEDDDMPSVDEIAKATAEAVADKGINARGRLAKQAWQNADDGVTKIQDRLAALEEKVERIRAKLGA